MPLLLPLLLALAGRPDIPWSPTYEEALEAAAGGRALVFVAIHMDDRPDCARMLEVYEEPRIEQLASAAASLVASGDRHAKDRCPLFAGLECDQHIAVDMEVRRNQLGSVAGRKVVAPQHLFLDSAGRVVLSVPFEVSPEELEWCFHAARERVDLSFDEPHRWEARAPRAVLFGEVVDPDSVPSAMPMPEQEVLQRIDDLKRGGQTPQQRLKLLQELVVADHPEAIEFTRAVLRSGVGGGRGSGVNARDLRPELLRRIGEVSPRSYHEVVSERIDGGVEELQLEAIVALEQLAAPGSLDALLGALRGAREVAVKKNLLRAIGAVGGHDARARKALLRHADDREPLVRRCALLGLGFLAQHEDVEEALGEALASEEPLDQAAAALGLAFTRERKWIAPLREAREVAAGGDAKAAIDGAIEVLEGARLSVLAEDVRLVGGDELPRARIFGGGPAGGRGRRR